MNINDNVLSDKTQRVKYGLMLQVLIVTGMLCISFAAKSQDQAGASLKTARDVALNYCLKTVDRYSGSPAVVLNLDLAETRTSGKNTVWYVFNINKEEGYIIISADINTTPVLCYVPRGSYNVYPESRSPAFNEWLDALAKQIEYNLNYGIKNDVYQDLWNSYLSKGAMDSETMVLKMTTEWDQDAYFNAYSPHTGVDGHPDGGPGFDNYANRTPTGCVATAMGQIMKYYQWPSTVNGDHSYIDPANPNSNSSCGSADPSYGELLFLNPGTPFNYSLMADKPQSVNYQISRLLYNSAVSVNMDFAYCQSWTNTYQVEEALESHFGYSTDAKYIVRTDYDNNEWLDAIKYQIRSERPVQYRGQNYNATVGHSFICYGYKTVDGEVQLLFNFGWTGESAVFLSLPGLTSYGLGYNNGAVVDIFPTSQPDLAIPSASSSASTISSGTPFDVSFRISNNGTRDAGEYTVSCYLSTDDKLDKDDTWLKDKDLPSLNSGQSIDDSFTGISIGDESSGSYYLLVEADAGHDVHESDEGDNVYSIAVTVTGTPAYDYRTVTTGYWTGTSTWERYEEGTWKTTTAHPTKSSGKITIRSGHNVTVLASISVDEVTVETGGTVTVSEGATLTVANGHDEIDFLVNGTVVNEGTVSSIGVLSFSDGSIYEHKINGGSIPVATWALTSNCKVTGMINSEDLIIPSATQPFGNFVWHCDQMGYAINLYGQLTSVNGNLNIVSTNSGFLRLGYHENGDLMVNGNFSMDAVNGKFVIAGDPNQRKMTVKGNFTLVEGGYVYIAPYTGSGTLEVEGDIVSEGNFYITHHSSGDSPGTLNVAGDCWINGGVLTLSSSEETGTLNVTGNFYHTGGTIWETSSGSGNIVFNGKEKQIFATTGEIYGEIDFTVNNGSYLQMATPETYITGAGSFELKDGATLGITSSEGITETGSGNTGNIRVTGTRSYSESANFVYNGTEGQNTGNGLPLTVNNLTFDNSIGTVTFTRATTISNNFSVTTGSKAGLGSFTHHAGRLTLGGIGRATGTYGSTGSTAQNKDDTFFESSTGVVHNNAPAGTWLGVTTDWNISENWSVRVPDGVTDVVIDSAVTNQPLISGTGTAACNDLTINPGASLSIEPGKALTVKGTITNSGTLNIYSDESDIASLLLEDTSPVQGNNEIHLHLTGGGSPGNYAWHYISFPFTNGVAASDIVQGLPDFNLAMYDESIVENSQNDGWVAWDGYIYSSGNTGGAGFTTMQPGYGYAHYYPTEQTYTVSGTINSGQLNVPLTFNTEASGRNPNIVGFNLVGNPFTCAIDWDEVADFNSLSETSEIKSAIYSYDLEGGQARYPAYVPEGPESNGGSRYIPPTQAFFVETDSPGQTLVFPAEAKVHNTAPRFKGVSDNTKIPMIRLLLDDGQISRDAVVWFNEKASLHFDNRFDARSLGKGLGRMSIWTKLNGADYSINGIPWPETSVEIPVAIHSSAGGAFTIRPQDLSGLEGFSVTLLDKVTKNSADLKTGGALSFTIGSGMTENRFVLIISDLVTGSESGLKNDNQFTIYELKGLLNIIPLSDTWNGKNGTIRILDLTGRSISLYGDIEFTKNIPVQRPVPAVKGLYFIEVRSGGMKHIGRVITK